MSVEIRKWLFSVDDYHRMVEAGILDEKERVELINGEVIAMSPTGPPHGATETRMADLLRNALGDGATIRCHLPIILNRYNEPEPDIAVVRRKKDFYYEAHPKPDDIFLIVEVADSSLAFDRRVKTKLYAEAGIPEYWIVDVNAKCLYAYSSPHQKAYRVVRELHNTETIAPILLPDCRINLKDLLP